MVRNVPVKWSPQDLTSVVYWTGLSLFHGVSCPSMMCCCIASDELSTLQLAIQMALDIGLGREDSIGRFVSEQEQTDLRLTWWNVVRLDIISSWGTPPSFAS